MMASFFSFADIFADIQLHMNEFLDVGDGEKISLSDLYLCKLSMGF